MVSIDNGEWATLDCEDGMSDGGVASPYVNEGQHSIALIAYGRDKLGRDGLPLYTAQGTFVATRGNPVSVTYRFYEVGGLSLRWDLWDGSGYRNCAEAGFSATERSMRINLLDLSTNTLVFGDDGDPQYCTGAPIVYQYLKPGRYMVYIRGMIGSTIAYTNEDSPTEVTVYAFEQKTRTDPATTIVLSN
jgi:hypothetical protein